MIEDLETVFLILIIIIAVMVLIMLVSKYLFPADPYDMMSEDELALYHHFNALLTKQDEYKYGRPADRSGFGGMGLIKHYGSFF